MIFNKIDLNQKTVQGGIARIDKHKEKYKVEEGRKIQTFWKVK
jgi:hypothetical protein